MINGKGSIRITSITLSNYYIFHVLYFYSTLAYFIIDIHVNLNSSIKTLTLGTIMNIYTYS